MESSTIALIIIGVMMILYIIDVIPIATTSILAVLALAIFGVIPFSAALGGFGSNIVFLIVGMVIVGDALFETGVAGLVGKTIISLVGTNERKFIGALFLVILPISAFLSNTATVAMTMPIAAKSIAHSNGKLTKKDIYMIIGLISVVGGGLTIVGSTPQLIAQSLFIENGIRPIGFFELSLIGLPIVALLAVYLLTFGHSLKKKIFDFPEAEDYTHEMHNESEAEPVKRTRAEIIRMFISIGVLVFCVVGFITELWTLGIVAMVGAVICVVTGCISQRTVFQKMNWTTVVIIGCSFGVAAGLEYSGAGIMIAYGMINFFGDSMSPWILCVILALVAVIFTNFMSSTATAALLIPIAAIVAAELGYDIRSMVIAVAVAANIGYATPISTPPITMTLAGGYRFTDYVKFGGLFNVMAFVLVILLFPLVLNI
ncbi:MAG: SLC13 family permease [Oscillospiraceae bacterium]|nr:SLC13 family permease [Oscillospiraceae bacterium]